MPATITRREPGLGTGIYTHSEAAWLLRVSPRKVLGWATGYVYLRRGVERQQRPVLRGTGSPDGLLTFWDLVELFFVREYRSAGVKLQEIRDASDYLSEELQTPYPFACSKLPTDGWQILRRAGAHYERVSQRQQVFAFAEDFFRDIDFDENCLAKGWWPMGKDRLIVIDPHRSFGAPIEVRSGIRADILHAAYKAEGNDIRAVADWYEVPQAAVRAAVDFEERWLNKAA